MGIEGSGDGSALGRSVRLSSRSGRIEVVAEARDDVLVERGTTPEHDGVAETVGDVDPDGGAPLTVSSRSDALRVRVPEGTDVVVGSVSGRVALRGRLGSVAVTTASGRISIDSADQVGARSISGRIEVEECRGEARVDSVSGRVAIGRTGSVKVSTKTGRVTVGATGGPVRVRSVVGRISIAIEDGPIDARLETVSGRIEVALPAGSAPRQRFVARSGSIRSAVPEGADGEIAARTLSGAIRVTEA